MNRTIQFFAVFWSTAWFFHGSSIIISASTLDIRTAPVSCNICQGNNTLINGEKEFTMSNGLTWTCEYLQETVQDVDENNPNGEGRLCRNAQLQAEWGECDCIDDTPFDDEFDEPSLSEQYIDPNDACNMCYGQENNFVPEPKKDALVNTGIMGTQACGGLYEAMQQGILSTTICPIIQKVAGPVCCTDITVSIAMGRMGLLRGSASEIP